jgi:competence protein ComEA
MKRWVSWLSVVALVVSVLSGGLVSAEENMALININSADEAMLVTLDQVGKTRAQAIIQYRQDHGPFKTTEQLKEVSGIGDKIFEVIKSKISVGEGQH